MATALGGFGMIATASSAQAVSCSGQPTYTGAPSTYSSGFFNTAGVRIRFGPSISCKINGQGYTGDRVTDYFYTYNSADGYFWDYVYDSTQNKLGWSREDLITAADQSYVLC